MIGRAAECAAIDALLAAARSGHSGVLVLRGEPGVGKSALLEYAAAAAADGMFVLRCTGVESEFDLAYAGLHQLLRPVVATAERLPDGQRRAVQTALGFLDARTPDRFLTAAGVLSMLAEVAERQPLLCIVDDAQWIDRATVEALGFAARRLDAEGVGVLVATRGAPWPGLAERTIGGLDQDAATALVRAVGGWLPDDECTRLVEQTGGNPLALIELAGSVGPGQVADHRPVPLTERLMRVFSAQVRGLSVASQRLLLIMAADDTAEPAVVGRAAQALDIPLAAWDEAHRAELVSISAETVTFRHPLVRAAVYHGADLSERMAVHRALADAVDGQLDRRAWHLAAATLGPSDQVAAELELSGERARLRGGHAAAATALARAAELSSEVHDQGRRLAVAAQSAFDAGDVERARGYAHRADPQIDDLSLRSELTHLMARTELVCGSTTTAHPLFLSAAALIAERAPERALIVLSEATWAAVSSGEIGRVADVAAALMTLRLPTDHPLHPMISAHIGLSQFFDGRQSPGLALLRRSIAALVRQIGTRQTTHIANMTLAAMTLVSGDDTAGLALGRAAVSDCRMSGAVGRLPLELTTLAHIEMIAERPVTARTHAAEAMRLARDLGQDHVVYLCQSTLAMLDAAQGNEDTARDQIAEAVQAAKSSHFTLLAYMAPWQLGLLELSLGKPHRAVEQLTAARRQMDEHSWPFADVLIVPDLVEAAARAGMPARAADTLAGFEGWVADTGQAWAQAVLYRSRALLSTDDGEAERYYRAAVGLHNNAGQHDRLFARARTRLLYGEWLRRRRRRADARTHLLAAHESFTRLDAKVWANRAEAELRANGETLRPPAPASTARLTPQELQVIRLAAEGGSNREIAAQLFLSPRTVGYHLSKAFRKLGIASRRQLVHLDTASLGIEE